MPNKKVEKKEQGSSSSKAQPKVNKPVKETHPAKGTNPKGKKPMPASDD